MNSTQKLVHLISGYPEKNSENRDEEYFKIEDPMARLHYLLDVVTCHDDIMPDVNIFYAFAFIHTDWADGHDHQAFYELGTN